MAMVQVVLATQLKDELIGNPQTQRGALSMAHRGP